MKGDIAGGAYIVFQFMCPLVGDADMKGNVCPTREERINPLIPPPISIGKSIRAQRQE
jgi:hypothetical protein